MRTELYERKAMMKTMMKTIGYKEKIGPLEIEIPGEFKSNNINECIECGVKITYINDSGWEWFTEKSGVTKTQPVCKTCYSNSDDIIMEKEIIVN